MVYHFLREKLMNSELMDQYQKLFDQLAKVIAHPHSTITEHDWERAAAVFYALHEYVTDQEQPFGGGESGWVNSTHLKFYDFLSHSLTEDELDKIKKLL